MAPRSGNGRRVAFVALQVAFAVTVIWFAGRALVAQWESVGSSMRAVDLRWGRVLLSCVLVLGAYAVLFETWRVTLKIWDAHLRFAPATRIWFVSNLGRYVPGKIWQISAMGVMARREGVSPVAATGSALVVNLANIVSGCVVAFATGPSVLEVAAASGRAIAVVLVVMALAMLLAAPWLLSWIAQRAEGITGRAVAMPATISSRAVLAAVAGTGIAWLLYGFAFRLLAEGVLPASASGRAAGYIAAYVVSYLAGYLALFAPGGIGVREAVLVLALSGAGGVSQADALVLAVASRLWLTALEVLPGVLFLLAGARFRLKETDARS